MNEEDISEQDILSILNSAKDKLLSGYAYDLISWLIDPRWQDESYRGLDLKYADLEVGDLFRTLILDENWSVEMAKSIYYSGIIRIEQIRKGIEE